MNLPPPPSMDSTPRNSNRESVDWYAGLAAESSAMQRHPSEPLPDTIEEEEFEVVQAEPVPQIQVDGSDDNALADVDMGTGEYIAVLFRAG